MKKETNLPAIPTPLGAVWREFRIQIIPFVVFALVICAAVYVWRLLPMSGGLRGVGEGLRSVVTSPRVGVVQRLAVEPFQWVEAGTPLLTIVPFDPDGQLNLLQSELQLARLRLEPSVADRNALNYEAVRLDALRLKEQLAMAKVNLEQAESGLKRNELLIKDKLVTRDIYEQSVRDRDFFTAEVNEKTSSLEEIDQRLEQLRGVGEPQSPGTNQVTRLLIARLEQRMAIVETNWGPITLVAPISGRVHMIARQQSEFVVEGEPLVMIASPRSDRIVAYLRQPFAFEPQPGMPVEVQLENKERQRFRTQIAEVGAQLEAITNALAFVQQGALVDMGLPIILTVPAHVQVRPGETVSISLRIRPVSFFGRNVNTADASKL